MAHKSSLFANNPPFISENKGSIDRVIEMLKNYLISQQTVNLFPTVCCFHSFFTNRSEMPHSHLICEAKTYGAALSM